MTFLAVPIAAETLDEARRMIRQAEREGAELIELRLDLLPDGAAEALPSLIGLQDANLLELRLSLPLDGGAEGLPPLIALPVLATCRDEAEGGASDMTELDRLDEEVYLPRGREYLAENMLWEMLDDGEVDKMY